MEENNLLTKSYQIAKNELQSLMIMQFEQQLKEQISKEDALRSQIENLKAENAEKPRLKFFFFFFMWELIFWILKNHGFIVDHCYNL
jgi:hypothetical protein